MKKVITKGYTLTINSWENDGDNSRTKTITIEDETLARAVFKMGNELFKSCNNGQNGIGNTNDGDDEQAERKIIEYMTKHPELYPQLENPSDDKLISLCMSYNDRMMGGSEWYYSRVLESITVTHSPEDVYLKEISFE